MPQVEGDFGDRLLHGAIDLLAAGHCRRDSDQFGFADACRRRSCAQAADAVRGGDNVVLSPAADGGYTLIGLSKPHARLFADIPWSTGDVYRLTLERAREIGAAGHRRCPAGTTSTMPPRCGVLEAELAGTRPPFAATSMARRRRRHGLSCARARPRPDSCSFPRAIKIVSVIIPCLNEEAPIAGVVREVMAQKVDEVIVVDNGSTDLHRRARGSGRRARGARAAARLRPRLRRRLARACASDAEIVCFLDGDGSDVPDFLPAVVRPVAEGKADFVMGSRLRGRREPGSMTPQQLVAGWLAGLLLAAHLRRAFHRHVAVPGHRRRAPARAGMS